jgi:signal transduction histidine kinase
MAGRARSDPAARAARALVPAAAAVGAATLLVVPRSDLVATTHAGTSTAGALAGAVAGVGLVAAAAVVWAMHAGRGVATVVALAGIVWFAPEWAGWLGGPPLARSIATVVEPFLLVLVVHVVLASAPGWSGWTARRGVVRALYVAVGAVSVGRALVRDPFLDPSCWTNCQDNVFLVSAQPAVARVLDGVWLVISFLAGLLLVAVTVRRLSASTRAERIRVWPVLVPGALLGLTFASYSAAVWGRGPERPHDPVFVTVFHARAWALVALALGVVWLATRTRRLRAGLAQLVTDVGAATAPGALGSLLVRATGDPRLVVAYPLDGGERHVDAAGRAVDLTSAATGRVVTAITRDDTPIALVIHERSAVDGDALRAEIGAAASIAVDNERLRAERLAQLEHLRASRERVVAAGDAERRRLERNLHDGAQQRLLALTHDLRLARAAAEGAGDTARAALLASAERSARKAVGDLRDLAHGIYPAVLTEAGIGPALLTLADDASLPLDLDALPEERFPEVVERTAFAVVAEAVDAASADGGDGLIVRVVRSGDHLHVEVEGVRMLPEHVADRVGAIGGRLETRERAVRAELPCG